MNHTMKFPIGIQNFESLLADGYVYVDKTAFIYQMVSRGRYYFLSRPRRFGKSLLVSTIRAYFEGKRHLFEGLALEKLEKEWTAYPIFYIDFNTGKYTESNGLVSRLNNTISEWENTYGKNETEDSLGVRFAGVIQRAHEKTGKRVVILVDEYDKSLLQAIDNNELQDEHRATLKDFYSVLKSQDEHIKFAFLTGVTKFSKVSVFSDLNKLQDISMDRRFSSICGIDEQELHSYFDNEIRVLSEAQNITYKQTREKLREKYDGYHFEIDTPGIYNPFSLLNTFEKKQFRNYWFETGTPTFLVELMKKCDFDLNNLTDVQLLTEELRSIDNKDRNPIPIIFQSGYLTIKSYNERFKTYQLGYPNEEVESAFVNFLLPHYFSSSEANSSSFIASFINDVEHGNPECFLALLQSLFADNSYQIQGKKEVYFQNMVYIIFKMLGLYVQAERATSRGRMDMIVQTSNYVYIFEFKIDQSAEVAVQQINEKGFCKPFVADQRKLYKIGINFSSETRDITDWKIEE